jgi:hypothetical protein
MDTRAVPHYAVFDDHRISQRITVTVRWFLLGVWLFLINYRTDLTTNRLLILDSMGVVIAVLNGYLHWRIVKGLFISRRFVVALSLMDLAVITGGIAATAGFQNIRGRTEEMGGQFNVLTERDSGTKVVFSCPTGREKLPPPQKHGR